MTDRQENNLAIGNKSCKNPWPSNWVSGIKGNHQKYRNSFTQKGIYPRVIYTFGKRTRTPGSDHIHSNWWIINKNYIFSKEYSRNYHNTVNQLYFNKTFKNEKQRVCLGNTYKVRLKKKNRSRLTSKDNINHKNMGALHAQNTVQ